MLYRIAVIAIMANMNVNLATFPKLKLNQGDIGGSFRSWLTQFRIAVELTELNMGVGENNQNRFAGRTKLLALLSAIGCEGVETLQSLGFDLASADNDA